MGWQAHPGNFCVLCAGVGLPLEREAARRCIVVSSGFEHDLLALYQRGTGDPATEIVAVFGRACAVSTRRWIL